MGKDDGQSTFDNIVAESLQMGEDCDKMDLDEDYSKSSITAESPLQPSPMLSPDDSDGEMDDRTKTKTKSKSRSKSRSKKKIIKHKKWRGPMASRKQLSKKRSKNNSLKSIESSLKNLRLDASKKKFSSRSPSPSPLPSKSKLKLETNLSEASKVQMRYNSESIFDVTASPSVPPSKVMQSEDLAQDLEVEKDDTMMR